MSVPKSKQAPTKLDTVTIGDNLYQLFLWKNSKVPQKFLPFYTLIIVTCGELANDLHRAHAAVIGSSSKNTGIVEYVTRWMYMYDARITANCLMAYISLYVRIIESRKSHPGSAKEKNKYIPFTDGDYQKIVHDLNAIIAAIPKILTDTVERSGMTAKELQDVALRGVHSLGTYTFIPVEIMKHRDLVEIDTFTPEEKEAFYSLNTTVKTVYEKLGYNKLIKYVTKILSEIPM